MASLCADKKHLVPLLEFLRYVTEKSKSDRKRFPRKNHGRVHYKKEPVGSDSERDSWPTSPGAINVPPFPGNFDDSSLNSQETSSPLPAASQRLKRERTSDEDAPLTGVSSDVPVEPEAVPPLPEIGSFWSEFVDYSLHELGLEGIVDKAQQPLTKAAMKRIRGARCCYLLLGTSTVVTGDILDVSFNGEAVLIAPDRELSVGVEWISLQRVFQVPENVEAIKEEVFMRVAKIIEAKRCGGSTPILPRVQLAKNPPSLFASLKRQKKDIIR